MNLKVLLKRSLIVLAAGVVALLILMRILLPRYIFEIIIIEGLLESVCWFGLLPLLIVGTPIYLAYFFLKNRRPPSE